MTPIKSLLSCLPGKAAFLCPKVPGFIPFSCPIPGSSLCAADALVVAYFSLLLMNCQA